MKPQDADCWGVEFGDSSNSGLEASEDLAGRDAALVIPWGVGRDHERAAAWSH